MNESQKVFINGVPGRGAEVIKALEDRVKKIIKPIYNFKAKSREIKTLNEDT